MNLVLADARLGEVDDDGFFDRPISQVADGRIVIHGMGF
jgi:hypothetical protein